MPFLTGGDLRFHLQTVGELHEQWVLWYACEMILALAALANNYVVHRDVKPGSLSACLTVRMSRKLLPLAKPGVPTRPKQTRGTSLLLFFSFHTL